MIKGLYAAASAMIAGVNRQKILAHNAANMDTPGFKQILSSLQDFTSTPVMYPPGDGDGVSPVSYLGDLGLGVASAPETTDYEGGPLNMTEHPFDLAISGPGFFHVRTPNGDRYTRDGRFQRDAQGQLLTQDGFAVLDKQGNPLTIPEGDFAVRPDGTISVNGQAAGQLGLAAFNDPRTELTRDDTNTFAAQGAPTSQTVGEVQQGYLEASNVNASQLMTQMISVARSYEAAQQMVQNQDELLGRTISTLGRLG